MADPGSGDRPCPPPSYNEAVDLSEHVPSAPSAPGSQGAYQPPQPSGQPPYPSGQPTYPIGQPPYPGQPTQQSYGQGIPPSTGPYQASGGTPGYTYPTQTGYGYGQPTGPQYSTVPGQPAQYTHSMVTAGPTIVTVASAGYQTTPLAYGHTEATSMVQRRRQIIAMCFCLFIIATIIIVNVVIFTSKRH